MSAHYCSLFAPQPSPAPIVGGPLSLTPLDDVRAAWAAALTSPAFRGDLIARPGERMLILAASPLVPAARAIAARREEALHGATDAMPAEDPRVWRDWDRVVAISRTGDEPELLHALRHLPPRVGRTAISVEDIATLSGLVDDIVALPELAGRSLVSFETTAILVARAALGDAVYDAPRLVSTLIECDVPAVVPGADHVVIVASGWAGQLALRGVHTLSAIRSIRAESHSLRDAHYGAIDHADARSVIWFWGKCSEEASERAVATGAVVIASQRDPLLNYIELQRMARELAVAAVRPEPR